MKKLAFLLFPFLLVGCASTGDWNEDTIAFSPSMADERLHAQAARIAAINNETEAIEQESRRVGRQVAASRAVNANDDPRTAELKSEIAVLEKKRQALQKEVEEARAADAPNLQELANLESEVEALKANIHRKRATLAFILKHR